MARYPTGVTIVSAIADGGEPIGMVVGTFTSVSLDPPLVAFMPSRASATFNRMRPVDTFAVNVLSARMTEVRLSFAACEQRRRWAGVGWRPSPSGAPIIDGALAWVECGYESVRPAGDHYIVVGRVKALGAAASAPPMLFYQGEYGTFRDCRDLTRGLEIA